MTTSAIFFAVLWVAIIFILGFVVAWLIFKTLEHQINVPSETTRPAREPNATNKLRLEVEKTRLSAEELRLRTEEVRLKALEARVGAMTGGVKRHDNSDSVDTD